jgi:SAM-dependent methyltransferase
VGVAGHLRISLEDYDEQIRVFVPHYDRLVSEAAAALQWVEASVPTIVDLGIGTGALSAACLAVRPDARLIGVDSDPAMLEAARSRLKEAREIELVAANFLQWAVPPCDAIVACISLHHVATPDAKRALYTRCAGSLRTGGCLVSADAFPARHDAIAVHHREAWLTHLRKMCSKEEAEGHLAAWADEDVYFPLADELEWMREAGLRPEVLWREAGFAVVAAFRSDDVGVRG